MQLIAFVDVHPPNGDGGLAGSLPGSTSRDLHPHALLGEVVQLLHARGDDPLVLEDLPRGIVGAFARVALLLAVERVGDLILLVHRLDAKAAWVQSPVFSKLGRRALEYGSAEISGIDGRITGDTAL